MSVAQADENRADLRYAYPKTVEYSVSGSNSPAPLKAVIVNISMKGVCLYLYNLHTAGETITIRSALPIPSRTARVKWIKKINAGFYKAGLEFIHK